MRLTKLVQLIAALAMIGLAIDGTVQADTISLTASQDSSLYGSGTGNDNGNSGGLYILAPSSYGVVQWDLSSLPAGAVITDAYFSVWELNAYNGGYHGVTSIINPPAGQSGISDATLTHNIFNGLDTDGITPSGYNYQAAAIAATMNVSYSTKFSGQADSVHADAGDLALINGRFAMASPSDQYLLLKLNVSDSTRAFFQDRELSQNSGVGIKPTLNLTYSVVPEPGTVVLSVIAFTGLCFGGMRRRARQRARQ